MSEMNDYGGGGGFMNAYVRFFWTCGSIFTGVVSLVLGIVYWKQESLLYFPAVGGMPRHNSKNPRRYRSPSEHNIPFETHMIPCADGAVINSWLLYHPENNNGTKKKKMVPTVIFFHGNAGNIGMRLPNAIQMYHHLKANIWLIEYRGFGDSDDATPNETGLKLDAEAVLDYVNNPQTRNMRSVDPKRLFVFGRSLGGAVAFHLAQYSQSTSHPPLAGVIVENTFLSISEMVDHLMPYFAPFKALILRMNWNSGTIAPTIKLPTLFLAGAMDTLVPHSHMLELFDRMKSSNIGKNIVRMHVVEDGTHNETWMQGGKWYWMAIQKFIDEVFEEERAMGGEGAGKQMSCKDSVEVNMGCEGGDVADMISSVGSLIGMAKEAVSGGVKGGGAADDYKKKD